MKLSFGLVTVFVAVALGQAGTTCTREMAQSDDCADVINPNACYNQFRFRNMQTLQCIAGKNDADRARKACKCCACVGTQMCSWVTQNRICAAGGG